MRLKRIFILGTVGSGKSTLARNLSGKLKIKHYDLDDIFWTSKFNKKRSEKERAKSLSNLIKKDEWIIEGVYADWIEQGIKRSNFVILLKIPSHTLFYRITKRTIKREKSKLKGEARYKENFKDYLNLIKAAFRYNRDTNPKHGYSKHKELIDRHKVGYIIIRNNQELKELLRDI